MEPAPPPPTQRRQLPHLPDEVVMLILSFLPLKSLMQYMCVCRSWKSLISSPMFAKLKYLRSPKDASIILTIDDTTHCPDMTIIHAVPCSVPSLLNFPSSPVSEDSFFPIMDDYYVVGTCHGLVCLAGPVWESEDSRGECWVKFWNPETRITSEKSPSLHFNSDSTVALNYGFGYDCENNVYKVVALASESESEEGRVKVFTVGDSCWRDRGCFPALPIAGRSTNENDGIYTNGTLNWLYNFSGEVAWEKVTGVDQLLIVSLDLGKETYKQIGLPDGLDELPKVKPVLGVLRDYLYLCHDYKTSHFVLWQMNEFGNAASWTQLLNVTYQHLQLYELAPLDELNHPLVPMCMSEKGDVVVLLSAADGAVILYDFKDDRVARYDIHGPKLWSHPIDYAKSLVSPNHLCETTTSRT